MEQINYARHICQYGIDRNPECYQMSDQLYFECKALNNAIETMTQEITSFKNKIFAQCKLKIDNATVLKAYNSVLKEMCKELKSWNRSWKKNYITGNRN